MEGFQSNTEENDQEIKIVNSKELIPGITDKISTETFEKPTMESKTLGMTTPYAESLVEALKHEKFVEFLKEFTDQVVVDIGAGITPSGYYIAIAGGAKSYVGVESYNFDHLKEIYNKYKKVITKEVKNIGGNMIPLSLEKEDMLKYLKRLPDHSVSILASGIDSFILLDSDYKTDLILEIYRVLHKEGAFISFDSDLHLDYEYLDLQGVRVDELPDDNKEYIFSGQEKVRKFTLEKENDR